MDIPDDLAWEKTHSLVEIILRPNGFLPPQTPAPGIECHLVTLKERPLIPQHKPFPWHRQSASRTLPNSPRVTRLSPIGSFCYSTGCHAGRFGEIEDFSEHRRPA